MSDLFITKLSNSLFVEKFERLSKKYIGIAPMDEVSTDIAKSHFDKSSLRFTFNKKEKFFKHVQSYEYQSFQLNISIKHGILETMFYHQKRGHDIEGGPLSRLVKLVKKEQEIFEYEKILYPRFDNYIKLEAALNDIILLFQEFICCYLNED